MHHSMYESCTDREKPLVLQGEALEPSFPDSEAPETEVSRMSMSALAKHCIREINNYRLGDPYDDQYCGEMLYRAIVQEDQYAREWFQRHFGEMVRGWLHCHPHRDLAERLDSEENYVAQTFERFWKETAFDRVQGCNTLTAALKHLQASLHSVILDTLRASTRPKETLLPEPVVPENPQVEEQESSSGLWELIQKILPNVRERRLAYLLFHCGLKPREILDHCPREFSDVQEIYRLRHSIVERIMHNPVYIRLQRGIC